MSCLVCDRIEKIKRGENPYFVCELKTGYVVLGDYQGFKGYTIFICKQHKKELYELDKDFRITYLEEMTLVAEAVAKVFESEKINYELLGNGDEHIHFHLFPRRKGDLGPYGNNGRGPVWWMPQKEMWKEENIPTSLWLEENCKKLRSEIQRQRGE